MKVRIPVILGVISVLTLSSCVSSKKYAQLQDRYDSLSKDYNQSQLDLTECNAAIFRSVLMMPAVRLMTSKKVTPI